MMVKRFTLISQSFMQNRYFLKDESPAIFLIIFQNNINNKQLNRNEPMYYYYFQIPYPQQSFVPLQFQPSGPTMDNHHYPMNSGIKIAPNIRQNQDKISSLKIEDGIPGSDKFVVKQKEQQKKLKKYNRKSTLEQDEYVPFVRPAQGIKKLNQNAKRSILPNVIHQIFCFLQNPIRSGCIVKRYFQMYQHKLKGEASTTRFYSYQKLFKEKTSKYINLKDLKSLKNPQQLECRVYSMKEQEIYLELTRILVLYFLKCELEPIILTSTRIKTINRRYYLEAKRKIKESLSELFKTEIEQLEDA